MTSGAVAVVAGLFGLMLGSFLNVCAHRWPLDQSVVKPASRCPSCENRVRWFDNLPVVSWLVLRGRCRDCSAPVSLQYPAVEAATGAIWAGTFAVAGLGMPYASTVPTAAWAEAARGALLLTLLLGIALTDARHYIIPDEFSLGGLALGLLAAPLPGGIDVRQALFGAVVGFGILWGVAVLGKAAFKKDAMGGGDIKMMAMVGGFLGVPGVLLTIFLGALFGSVIFGPISYRTGKLVPFGIFLALGAAATYVWGDAILGWYMTEILGLPPRP